MTAPQDPEDSDDFVYTQLKAACEAEGISTRVMSKLVQVHGMPVIEFPEIRGCPKAVKRSVLRKYIRMYVRKGPPKNQPIKFTSPSPGPSRKEAQAPGVADDFFGGEEPDWPEPPPPSPRDPQAVLEALNSIGDGVSEEEAPKDPKRFLEDLEDLEEETPDEIERRLRGAGKSSSEVDLYRDLEFSRQVVKAVFQKFRGLDPSESPTHARLFGQYAEIISKGLSRVLTLEERILKIQERRGELLDFDTVSRIISDVSVLVIRAMESFSFKAIDTFKKAEFNTYKDSRIDSEELMDRLQLLLEDSRQDIANSLRGVETPKDTEISPSDILKAIRETPNPDRETLEESSDD